MSSLNTALGGSDINPALLETIFTRFQEEFVRMTSSTSTTTPSKHAFEARVADVKAPKRLARLPSPPKHRRHYDDRISMGISPKIPCGEPLHLSRND